MRVLLVEDDPLIGSGLEQGLKQEGFAVDWAQNADAATLALRTTSYGLLLLDLGLPDKDGLAVLAALRRRDDALPVIVVTARDALPTGSRASIAARTITSSSRSRSRNCSRASAR